MKKQNRTKNAMRSLAAALLLCLIAGAGMGCERNDPADIVDTEDRIQSIETEVPVESTTTAETEPIETKTPAESAIPADYDTVKAAWEAVITEGSIINHLFTNAGVERHIEWITQFTVALVNGDGNAMAEVMGVAPEIYACYNGIAISDWSAWLVPLDYYGETNRCFTVLDITVTESNAEGLPVGTHSLVLEDGMVNTFTLLENFVTSPITYPTSAQDYVNSLFYKSTQFGICDFIVARLDKLAGNYDPRTVEEIKEYARVCMDLDLEMQEIEYGLQDVEGGYIRIGRGMGRPAASIIGEEVRGDVTVVTVRYFADFSHSVEAKLVEYHLTETPIDWKVTDTVTVSDRGFEICHHPGT